MKQYIGISRDHSGSMQSISRTAMRDYNQTIKTLKTASQDNDIDTIVTVVRHEGKVVTEVTNSGIDRLTPLTEYKTPGSHTPLFDSVETLIDQLEKVPDAFNNDVSFLIIAVTDGQDNSSKIKGDELGQRIRKLQATDHWTFVFRVPYGYKRNLENLGIPSGNIQEWEQTEHGFIRATEATTRAINNFYGMRSSTGATSSMSFYADMGNIPERKVARKMANISDQVGIFPVTSRRRIDNFFTSQMGFYIPGRGFYQLSKTEKKVQKYKLIVVRNRASQEVYGGREARELLNLPTDQDITLKPGDHGDWDIFIQSTSNNRALLPGTSALYWRMS